MSPDVIGPLSDPAKAAIAAKHLQAGKTVVVWDENAEALRRAVETLPSTPPGRLCSWSGSADSPALQAFIQEILDPTVK